mmetsp:Transcript_95502/g.247332  ORF Transcript_95502/g.247332 Transcript_95502/m.247332 type:complete len:316 (+) Transcript_95502:983-1930(+)
MIFPAKSFAVQEREHGPLLVPVLHRGRQPQAGGAAPSPTLARALERVHQHGLACAAQAADRGHGDAARAQALEGGGALGRDLVAPAAVDAHATPQAQQLHGLVEPRDRRQAAAAGTRRAEPATRPAAEPAQRRPEVLGHLADGAGHWAAPVQRSRSRLPDLIWRNQDLAIQVVCAIGVHLDHLRGNPLVLRSTEVLNLVANLVHRRRRRRRPLGSRRRRGRSGSAQPVLRNSWLAIDVEGAVTVGADDLGRDPLVLRRAEVLDRVRGGEVRGRRGLERGGGDDGRGASLLLGSASDLVCWDVRLAIQVVSATGIH